jgi:hypothetical protein
VDQSAGLLFVVAGPGAMPYENSQNLTLHGTNDWGRHAAVFDVPDGTAQLAVGFGLFGPGAVWADNFSITVVETSVPLTRTLPSAPVDPDFNSRRP